MEKNSKDALKLKVIIVLPIIIIAIILGTRFVSLTDKSIQEESKDVKENTISEELKVGSTQDSFERNLNVTSRSTVERFKDKENLEVVNEEETKYIPLSEITISKGMDLSKRCGISKEDFKILISRLKPDTTKFFYDNADTIYDLCEKYEINEIFFCGLIAGESGWKISQNHRNKCNYISMMSKGSLIRYSSPAEGLEAAAKLLHKNYLTEGGAFYSGKTIYGVQKRFCPNSSTWVGLIYGCMNQIVKNK